MEINMAEHTVSDIIDYAIDGDVVKIQASVNDYMKEKVAEVLAAKKIEVGKTLFNSEE
jgi:DNA polymerase III delta subunit